MPIRTNKKQPKEDKNSLISALKQSPDYQERLKVAKENQKLLYDAARNNLSDFAEIVFNFDNGKHHHEWYNVLMNKLRTPLNGDWDTPLEPAPKDWVNERIGIMAPRNHAKSTCFTVVYPLWVIGNNPNIRILIVSNSAMQAQAFLREIKDKITKSDMYRTLFGDLFPEDEKDPGEKWTNQEIIVRREATHKDPTVSAMGAGGAILSKRADIIICDDILNLENTRTAAQRANIKQWYNEVLMPVLEPDGIIINVGTAWNLEDLLHEQLHNQAYDVRRRYKAISDSGEPLWGERWSYEKLMELKKEVGSVAFNKSYMNEAMSSEDTYFKQEWLQTAKEYGKRLTFSYSYSPENWQLPLQPKSIAMGVDLAISDVGDNTAFSVIAELKNGAKIPLWLEEKKIDFATTERMIVDLARRFHPEIIVVENNGYQAALVRDLQGKTSLPIVPYSTGGEKYDPVIGINSIAVEFENQKWILPYDTRVDENGDYASPFTIDMVDRLCDGMMKFGSGHTADILMATWFANGGLRRLSFNNEGEEPYAFGSRVDPLRR